MVQLKGNRIDNTRFTADTHAGNKVKSTGIAIIPVWCKYHANLPVS